jgi:hypothetical protein
MTGKRIIIATTGIINGNTMIKAAFNEMPKLGNQALG